MFNTAYFVLYMILLGNILVSMIAILIAILDDFVFKTSSYKLEKCIDKVINITTAVGLFAALILIIMTIIQVYL